MRSKFLTVGLVRRALAATSVAICGSTWVAACSARSPEVPPEFDSLQPPSDLRANGINDLGVKTRRFL